jgi:hypothetical protein
LKRKEYLVGMLRGAGHEVFDSGDGQPQLDDDHSDFVVPLARAIACGEVERGVAICGKENLFTGWIDVDLSERVPKAMQAVASQASRKD